MKTPEEWAGTCMNAAHGCHSTSHYTAIVDAIRSAVSEAQKEEREACTERASEAYAEAVRNGCDPNGAWECALDAIHAGTPAPPPAACTPDPDAEALAIGLRWALDRLSPRFDTGNYSETNYEHQRCDQARSALARWRDRHSEVQNEGR